MFNQQWPDICVGHAGYLRGGGKLVPFGIGYNKTLFTQPEYAARYRDALAAGFESSRLTAAFPEKSFAGHEVVILVAVPRTPAHLARTSPLAAAQVSLLSTRAPGRTVLNTHMKPAPFSYHLPRSLPEAVSLLTEYGDDAKALAGGQSLIAILGDEVEPLRAPDRPGWGGRVAGHETQRPAVCA